MRKLSENQILKQTKKCLLLVDLYFWIFGLIWYFKWYFLRERSYLKLQSPSPPKIPIIPPPLIIFLFINPFSSPSWSIIPINYSNNRFRIYRYILNILSFLTNGYSRKMISCAYQIISGLYFTHFVIWSI